MLPGGEHWRMLSAFAGDAAYLDIETGDDDVAFAGISAIGWFDRDGPRIFLAGRDLHLFPQIARGHSMLVTFNGLSFDVPILRRAFPEWTPPRCHVDLRHVHQPCPDRIPPPARPAWLGFELLEIFCPCIWAEMIEIDGVSPSGHRYRPEIEISRKKKKVTIG